MSRILKRSIMIAGHGTSVSLEPEFWEGLKAVRSALRNSLRASMPSVKTATCPRLCGWRFWAFIAIVRRLICKRPNRRALLFPLAQKGCR